MMGQRELSATLFPMGEFAGKAEARELARGLGLHLADKPDLQEICFVSEAGGYKEFLRKANPGSFAPGAVVDESGREVGVHEGLPDFTVGQRRGIGVSGRDPLYVLRLESAANRVIVGADSSLLCREVALDDFHAPASTPRQAPERVMAKIRYNMEPRHAILYREPDPRLVFDEPVRAATPGQIAVAYRGASVIGGGVISSPRETIEAA